MSSRRTFLARFGGATLAVVLGVSLAACGAGEGGFVLDANGKVTGDKSFTVEKKSLGNPSVSVTVTVKSSKAVGGTIKLADRPSTATLVASSDGATATLESPSVEPGTYKLEYKIPDVTFDKIPTEGITDKKELARITLANSQASAKAAKENAKATHRWRDTGATIEVVVK